jgi:hypothetical protein
MRSLAACLLLLACACGPEVHQTQNRVMENWPKAPVNEVAGAAVGAAVLMTIADPKSAGKPEAPDDPGKLEGKPSPQMPAALLDHDTTAETQPAPCAPPAASQPSWVPAPTAAPAAPGCR